MSPTLNEAFEEFRSILDVCYCEEKKTYMLVPVIKIFRYTYSINVKLFEIIKLVRIHMCNFFVNAGTNDWLYYIYIYRYSLILF